MRLALVKPLTRKTPWGDIDENELPDFDANTYASSDGKTDDNDDNDDDDDDDDDDDYDYDKKTQQMKQELEKLQHWLESKLTKANAKCFNLEEKRMQVEEMEKKAKEERNRLEHQYAKTTNSLKFLKASLESPLESLKAFEQVCDKAPQVCDKAPQVSDKAPQVSDKAPQVDPNTRLNGKKPMYHPPHRVDEDGFETVPSKSRSTPRVKTATMFITIPQSRFLDDPVRDLIKSMDKVKIHIIEAKSGHKGNTKITFSLPEDELETFNSWTEKGEEIWEIGNKYQIRRYDPDHQWSGSGSESGIKHPSQYTLDMYVRKY